MWTKDQFERAQPLLTLGFAVVLVLAIGVSIWRDSRSSGGTAVSSSFVPRVFDNGVLVPSSVDTGMFDGRYKLVADESFMSFREKLAAAEAAAKELESAGKAPDASLKTKIAGIRFLLRSYEEQMDHFTIRDGVIRSGKVLVMELSLVRASIDGNTLDGTALLHEDIYDPGDCQNVRVWLKLTGDRLEFVIGDSEEAAAEPVILERIPKDDDSK